MECLEGGTLDRTPGERDGSHTQRIITLTTDFGASGPFVGSMKGVILGINPQVQIIDIAHEISPFDLLDAAFMVSCAYSYFPARTIHCIVVDPGVGGERRPIVAVTTRYSFVAPDNGVLSYIYERESIERVIHLKEHAYFLPRISRTFHGRDIFAPAAAWLSRGVDPQRMGPVIDDYVRCDIPRPKVSGGGTRIQGRVIHIDIFGNLVTNIPFSLVEDRLGQREAGFSVTIKDIVIDRLCKAYEDAGKGKTGAIVGSHGYIELFSNQDSLARQGGIAKGEPLEVILG
ncbi:MAG: S-adenosyl-l-methionine hydroxide adenosyltransferase family protein [bacterium]